MDYYLEQLESSLDNDLPLLSLLGTFTAIDIISALESEDGKTSTSKFISWFEKYLPEYEVSPGAMHELSNKKITANDYNNFRCSLLHQLTGSRDGDTFNSIAFFPKNSQVQAHLSLLQGYFFIEIERFVNDVIQAIRNCMEKSTNYPKHKDSIITLHPEGLPFIDSIINIGKPIPIITSKKKGAPSTKYKKSNPSKATSSKIS